MRAAILGYGTVGKGVYEMLCLNVNYFSGKVLVKEGKADEFFKTEYIEDIVSDEFTDTVIECMGGVHPAYEYAVKVIEAGKNFITSNKVLVAARGPELAALAKEHGVAFLFSAACGGAIPFLANMKTAMDSGDRILSIEGIFNGTTNYVLDQMQTLGMGFGDALELAKRLGFSEADPIDDLSGMDTMRKLMLSSAVAFNKIPYENYTCEGIFDFTSEDAQSIKELGLVCRLKGKVMPSGDSLCAYVEPVLVSGSSMDAATHDSENLARYEGENSGMMSFGGKGAGRYPTASAVMRDIAAMQSGTKEMMSPSCVKVTVDNSVIKADYYVRVTKGMETGLLAMVIGENEDFVWGIMAGVSVSEMHDTAERIRSNGGKIFYAACEGEIRL